MSDARDAENSTTAANTPVWPRLLGFWIVTRVWLTFWAVMCSVIHPVTPLEKQVAAWPPSAGWLSRVLLAPWDRWDAEHFQRIASVGYLSGEGTLAFQPLFPYLGKAIGAIFGGRNLLGMALLGNLCGFLFLVALCRLAELDLPRERAYRAAVYFMALPCSFILFAPYTESLFLLLAVQSLWWARHGKWWWAGLAGGLAALTRQQGLFLIVPLAWEFWERSGRNWKTAFGGWRGWFGLALTPAGYAAWIAYRAVAVNDVVLDFGNPHRIFYGLLLSPNAQQVVANQRFMPPWQAMWLAITHPDSANTVDLLSGAAYLLLFALVGSGLWRMRRSYFLYTAVLFAVSFSYSTWLPHSYMGLPRHCLLAFPLVMPLAVLARKWTVRMLITALGLGYLMALSSFYFLRAVWVP